MCGHNILYIVIGVNEKLHFVVFARLRSNEIIRSIGSDAIDG